MSRFVIDLRDGPAKGMYATDHAPRTLVAVTGRGGTRDVLDAPDDAPRAEEVMHPYRFVEAGGQMFVCSRGQRARSMSGQHVTYRHAPDETWILERFEARVADEYPVPVHDQEE